MMKKVILVFALFGMVGYGCSEDCTPDDVRCDDAPATGITCQAYFESWLYNSDTKKCEFVGYSGCNEIGFQTKEECELCDCN